MLILCNIQATINQFMTNILTTLAYRITAHIKDLIICVGNRTINYFSLDIEGAEMQVFDYIFSSLLPWELTFLVKKNHG